MKISVLGSGNGALAVAFDWAQFGHEVYLCDFKEFDKNIRDVNELGYIEAEGKLSGKAKIAYAGHDFKKTIEGSKLIFIVGPAYSTEAFAKAVKPYYEKGQTYIIFPGSCAGSLVFKNTLGLDIDDESLVIAESSTLPYAVRISGKAKVFIYNRLRAAYYLAALPSSLNDKAKEMLVDLYPEIILAKNILQTTLQNANPIIHPSVTISNSALIERSKGDFLFYEEGVTQGVGRIIEALDKERIAIGKELGVDIVSDPELGMMQGYQSENNYSTGYSEAPGFKGIMAQDRLEHRYIEEDAGYGLVLFADLAKFVGIDAKNINAVINICSILNDKDYTSIGNRTLESLKLDSYTKEELLKIL